MRGNLAEATGCRFAGRAPMASRVGEGLLSIVVAEKGTRRTHLDADVAFPALGTWRLFASAVGSFA